MWLITTDKKDLINSNQVNNFEANVRTLDEGFVIYITALYAADEYLIAEFRQEKEPDLFSQYIDPLSGEIDPYALAEDYLNQLQQCLNGTKIFSFVRPDRNEQNEKSITF